MLFETTYKYAGFDINAAQDDDGNYWISAGTFDKITQTRLRRLVGTKRLEPILGKDHTSAVWSSKTTKSNRKKNFISLSTFLGSMAILAQPYELDSRVVPANQQALNFVIAGFVSDFTTSLKTHFGEQFSEEQREYLRDLVFSRLQAFKAWTDIIRDRYMKFYGVKPEGWYYAKLIKHANLTLFGVPNFGSDRTTNMTTEQQETIKEFELFLARKARNNDLLEPEALLQLALDQFTN